MKRKTLGSKDCSQISGRIYSFGWFSFGYPRNASLAQRWYVQLLQLALQELERRRGRRAHRMHLPNALSGTDRNEINI